MFLSERIKSIRDADLVLDVGPGALPYARADIALDVQWDSATEAHAQRGYAAKPRYKVPLVLYDGTNFPFRDKVFDYVICSHVIEHIPAQHMAGFLHELSRVSPRGYVEYPTVFYELVNYQPVHRWFMNTRHGEILMLRKEAFMPSRIHVVYRDMVYHSDGYLKRAFRMYKEVFFSGFEWEGSLRYRIVDTWDELVDEDDVARFRQYLASRRPPADKVGSRPLPSRILGLAKRIVKRVVKLRRSLTTRDGPRVHRTAIIDRKPQVALGSNVEIQEYVIIRPGRGNVSIGSNSQINPFSVIYGGSGVHIGANVMIGPHCTLAAGNHDYKQTDKPMRFAGGLSRGPIVVEDDVWIGANCTVTGGVRIQTGAVVGANSVVTHDVEPCTIVAGAPARTIGYRGSSHPVS